jgi:hypothetical protein
MDELASCQAYHDVAQLDQKLVKTLAVAQPLQGAVILQCIE